MSNLLVGYGEVVANPPLGIGISGYYVPRFAKGFLTDIKITVAVIKKDEQTIALIGIDNEGVEEKLIDRFCQSIEKETGIKSENVMISASHTHTGPLLYPMPDFFIADEKIIAEYAEFFEKKLIEAVKIALGDLKPSKMGYREVQAPKNIAFIRRYKMKDGSTMTCPPLDDNIDYPLGELDERVNVVRFDRENAEPILFVNFGLHVDCVNGEMISADWPHWMRETLKGALGGVKTIFFNGAEGDVGSTNPNAVGGDMNDTEISFDNEMKSPGMSRFIGRAMAGAVLQVYDKVHYVNVDSVLMIKEDVKIKSNMPTKEQMPTAKLYKKLHEEGRDDEIPFKAMELTTAVAEAMRMCNLEHGPEFFDVRLTGVKLGPVAMLGISGEPFTDIGVELKKTEGFEMIMPCSLTNGNIGYFPTKSAYDEGGYEAKTSPFASDVAETIIKNGKNLLEKLNK